MRGKGKSRFLQKKRQIEQIGAFETLYVWSSDRPTNLHCRSVLFRACFALPKLREGEG